jgi:hypothetical protein
MRRLCALLVLAACAGGEAPLSDTSSANSGVMPVGSSAESSGTTGGTTGKGSTTSGTSGAAGSSGGEGSTGEAPSQCSYAGAPAGPLELDVPVGSPERLVFTVAGLPAPSEVLAATLRFTSWDADHPGEEGVIVVNDGAGIDLPADAAWENLDHLTEVDVGGRTLAGDNTIAFAAGSLAAGSFYRVGGVSLELTQRGDCPAPPDRPDGPPSVRQLGFEDAVYTDRHNWVLRCQFDPSGYAYTAKGEDHVPLDCDGLYMPDGTTHGTATFTFTDVVPATYEVSIYARHTPNRNPEGARFVVDGEARRVPQNDDQDFVVDVWGTKELAGDVDVVLDSTMETASDSVIWVRLSPV